MLNNNTYNIVTALQNKAEATAAYDKYIQDAQQAGSQECVELFQQFKQQDEQAIDTLKQHVQMLIERGQF